MKYNLLIVFLALMGCQTFDRSRKASLSANQRAFFSSCNKGDGYSFAEFYLENKLYFKGDFEWLVSDENSYSFEVVSPLGQNLLWLKNDNNMIEIKDHRSKKGRIIKIDQDNFIHFNHYWTGLKSKEFACFLDKKLSSSWLSNPRVYSLNEENTKFYFDDGKRNIVVEFLMNEDKSIRKVCTDISWNSFWIFKTSHIRMCFEKKDIDHSFLDFDKKFLLKIKEIYED